MSISLDTMIENLKKNTGNTLEDWLTILRKEKFTKHGDIIKFLKGTHQVTHGYANLIAHKFKENQSEPAEAEDFIEAQYKGKEHFLPLYNQLVKFVTSLGNDVEVSPKKSYVSIRRAKQFAIINPATKTRFEIGLNLKGVQPTEILLTEKPNAMCSHKINLSSESELNENVFHWITEAYITNA